MTLSAPPSPLTLVVLLAAEVPTETPATLEAPESISRVVFPRFLKFLKSKYPDQSVRVVSVWSEESLLRHKEELEQASAVFALEHDGSCLPALYAHAKNLRWLHSLSAGVDRFMPFLKSTHSHKNASQTLVEDPSFLVTNGKGVFARPLAEYVVAAILYFAKDILQLQKRKDERSWTPFPMDQLRGKTAFGMRCVAIKRTPNSQQDSLAEKIWTPTDPDRFELFKSSDYVVCSLPGTPETRHAVGREEFAAMKPSAVFVSIGRGSAVDETALFEALQKEALAGAALDVFETEPLPKSSPLWGAENLLISPHCCDWVNDHSAEEAFRVFDENFRRFRQGAQIQQDMYTPIDKQLGY
ncbi:putative D-3-phosphoglycerate dehydrogenase [Neospora caninum Liverpool]|uniref:Putative D-3-phosphoglycerate dehydrogenase n=1 Tax=Neospora caninum (strain Liverpool) TaxID=572307 RepID=F0VL03_NEOCL|nr:putative D-3-phosphoglycerate dehydrogenase [Neospora caninum Liverpool]CBZ54755.1 putative D-3-phosphoglycerate dehydrogenase [Neospora caninum Liverpool]|eukprot:XP_003884783.1 putative D-3-phosphoglycerate dehydrogenase [Neospora caninum Liverpool]